MKFPKKILGEGLMVNIPVVFCFDKRIILGASIAIKSLIDCANSNTSYDIRIFHSDIDIKDQRNITLLAEKTNHNIAFHYINPDRFKDFPHNNASWTEIVYYRFLIPEVLKEYDKVIYSDVDVLFKEDLAEVYGEELTGFEWAGVRAERNSKEMLCHKYFEENSKEYIFWSGFMVMNCKKMRNTKFLDRCLETTRVFCERLKFFDLDVINIASQNIKSLPFKYVTLQSISETANLSDSTDYIYLKNVYTDEELIEAKNNPAIKHYAGKQGKPWRMKKTYKDYQEYMDKLPIELKKYTFRDLRKRFFNKV